MLPSKRRKMSVIIHIACYPVSAPPEIGAQCQALALAKRKQDKAGQLHPDQLKS